MKILNLRKRQHFSDWFISPLTGEVSSITQLILDNYSDSDCFIDSSLNSRFCVLNNDIVIFYDLSKNTKPFAWKSLNAISALLHLTPEEIISVIEVVASIESTTIYAVCDKANFVAHDPQEVKSPSFVWTLSKKGVQYAEV